MQTVRAISTRHLRVYCRANSESSFGGRPTPGNDPRFRNAGPNSRPTPGNDPRLTEASKFRMTAAEPANPDLKVIKLQDANVQGVAMIDSGENDWQSDSGRVALLVGGDATALLLFAAIGRINHGEVLDVETLSTALPFWLGWFAAAPLLGGFGKEAQGGYVGAAAMAAARCWAVATPIALVLRSIGRGYTPPMPFIVIAFAVTGALLIGWRSALAAVTKPEEELTPLEKFKRRKNRKGTAGEFMQLLSSLTNRW